MQCSVHPGFLSPFLQGTATAHPACRAAGFAPGRCTNAGGEASRLQKGVGDKECAKRPQGRCRHKGAQ